MQTSQHAIQLKPGFHYPSWRPELTARVDGWPVSISLPVNTVTRAVLTGARFPPAELTARVDGEWKPVTRQVGPSTRLVETGPNRRIKTAKTQSNNIATENNVIRPNDRRSAKNWSISFWDWSGSGPRIIFSTLSSSYDFLGMILYSPIRTERVANDYDVL